MLLLYFGILSLLLSYYMSCIHYQLFRHPCWFLGTTCCYISIVSKITNINFRPDDPSWLQATLLVSCGGLGIRRASHLAPTAFLSSDRPRIDVLFDTILTSCSDVESKARLLDQWNPEHGWMSHQFPALDWEWVMRPSGLPWVWERELLLDNHTNIHTVVMTLTSFSDRI